MTKYKIVTAAQTESVLKKEYEFRANIDKLNSIHDQDEGVWSDTVSRDLPRISLLIPEEALQAYTEKLSKLNGKDYVQGDLYGGSSLVMIKTTILEKNLRETGSNQNSTPYSFEFGYLREDECIGGVNVYIDPLTSNIFLAVISYPQETATSYNHAVVTRIFPEDIAGEVLNEKITDEAVDEKTMLEQLKERLNNKEVYELIEPIINQKSILLSAGQIAGNAKLFNECSRTIEIEVPHSKEQNNKKKVQLKIVEPRIAKEQVANQKEILKQQSKQYPLLEQYKNQIMVELESLKTNILNSKKIKKSGKRSDLLNETEILKNNITIYLQNPTQNELESLRSNINSLIKSLDLRDPPLAKQGSTLMNLIDAFIAFISKLFGRSQLEHAKKTIKSIKEEVEKIEQPPLKEEVEEIKQPTLNK